MLRHHLHHPFSYSVAEEQRCVRLLQHCIIRSVLAVLRAACACQWGMPPTGACVGGRSLAGLPARARHDERRAPPWRYEVALTTLLLIQYCTKHTNNCSSKKKPRRSRLLQSEVSRPAFGQVFQVLIKLRTSRKKCCHLGREMPQTGRLKASASAPPLIAAPRRLPGSSTDLTRVDAQARFQTPPVHIYATGLDGPRAATSKRLEGNEHYLLPRQKPPNPRQVAIQRELSLGGGRRTSSTWAEAKPSTAASAATTIVAPLRTHTALPPEHRLPNSYLDAERRASAEPQTHGGMALCRKRRPERPASTPPPQASYGAGIACSALFWPNLGGFV